MADFIDLVLSVLIELEATCAEAGLAEAAALLRLASGDAFGYANPAPPLAPG